MSTYATANIAATRASELIDELASLKLANIEGLSKTQSDIYNDWRGWEVARLRGFRKTAMNAEDRRGKYHDESDVLSKAHKTLSQIKSGLEAIPNYLEIIKAADTLDSEITTFRSANSTGLSRTVREDLRSLHGDLKAKKYSAERAEPDSDQQGALKDFLLKANNAFTSIKSTAASDAATSSQSTTGKSSTAQATQSVMTPGIPLATARRAPRMTIIFPGGSVVHFSRGGITGLQYSSSVRFSR